MGCTAALFKTREWHSSSQSRCPPSVSITAAHSKRATCGELPYKHSRLHCVGRSASRGHRRLHCVGQSASCAVSFRVIWHFEGGLLRTLSASLQHPIGGAWG